MCHQWVTPFIRQVPKAGHYPPGAVLMLKGERSGGWRGKFQELSCFIWKLFFLFFWCWFKTLSLQGHLSKTGLLFVTLKFQAQTVLALKWKLLKFD